VTDSEAIPPDDLGQPVRMVVKPSRFARDLTSGIKRDLGKLDVLHQRTLSLYCDVGDKLAKLRTELPHGAWGWWLETNFGLTDRTARYYMDLAANRKHVSEMEPSTPLRAAVAQLRAERNAERAQQEPQTFTPEQLAKRSLEQRKKATRRGVQRLLDAVDAEQIDPSLMAESWTEAEWARVRVGLAGVVQVAQDCLAARDQPTDAGAPW
jgi:hypothetical protein